jgi:tetratricopeptide (TPR) repeat protein
VGTPAVTTGGSGTTAAAPKAQARASEISETAPAIPNAPAGSRFFRPDRWDLMAGGAVFLLALATRLMYVYQIHAAGLGRYLRLDPLYYHRWGLRIAGGDWLGREAFEMSPLYAYHLGLLYRLFGDTPIVPQLIQCVLAALLCGLLGLVGRRAFGKVEGVIAGAAFALYAPALFYDGQVMKTSLEISLTALMTFAFFLAGLDAPYPRKSWIFAGGFLLGLTALSRENILVAAPVLLVWVLWPRRGYGTKAKALAGLVLIAATTLPILPATVRNVAVARELVLISALGGENFYTGNNVIASGRYVPPPFVRPDPAYEHEDFRREAERRAGRPLTRREASDYWFKEGLRFIAGNPGRYLWLLWDKLAVFWNDFERPDNFSFYNFRRFSSFLNGPLLHFAWVAPLGLLGIALSAAGWRRFVPLYITLGAYVGSALIFFTQSRYRMPAVPILCLFAAHALVVLAGAIRRRSLETIGWSVPLLALLAIFVMWNPGNTALFRAQNRSLVADMFRESGKLEEAAAEYRASLEELARLPIGEMVGTRRVIANAHFGLARTLVDLGKETEALPELREAAQSPRPEVRFAALSMLGVLLDERGDLRGAANAFGSAVREDPGSYEARMLYAEALAKLGRLREALDQVEEALRLRPTDPDARRIRDALAGALARGG